MPHLTDLPGYTEWLLGYHPLPFEPHFPALGNSPYRPAEADTIVSFPDFLDFSIVFPTPIIVGNHNDFGNVVVHTVLQKKLTI